MARGYLRSADECADAVQEMLCKAWNKRHTIAPEPFQPWLMRIVINECRNVGRRQRCLQPMAEVEHQPPSRTAAFDLAQELAALDEKLRAPLLLHDLEGFSIEEIAQILCLPMGTVKSRLHKARKVLHLRFGKEEDQ